VGREFCRRRGHRHGAVEQKQREAANAQRLGDMVVREKNRGTCLGDVAKQSTQPLGPGWVDSGEGFVADQQSG
jgi:hypothetical protein